jgi:hypothetical protein
LKRATDNAKKEYLENICNEIVKFQGTWRYDLMYIEDVLGEDPFGFRRGKGTRDAIVMMRIISKQNFEQMRS